MTTKTILLVCGAASALAAAGCVERQAGLKDPYAAALYTGAPQPDRADHFAQAYAPQQVSKNGTPFEMVSYEGIEGARRAHARYTEEEAEALDGRCERYIEASASESLIDVANLCDVPLDMLVDYNPDISNVSYAAPGAVIEIPGGSLSPKGAFAMRDALTELYVIEDGDTVEKIALKLDVSQSALAAANPGITWSNPTPGQAIVRPTTDAVAAAAYAYAPPTPAPAWEGYAAGRGIGSSDAGRAIGTPHAPYALEPVKAYARAAGVYPEATIDVDREFVKPGENVRVTVRDLRPGEEVRIYGGKRTATRRADDRGVASAEVEVRDDASIGGLIFEAKPARSGGTRYSKRVGVVTLEKTLPGDEDETAETDEEADEE